MKRFLYLFIVLALAASLQACGTLKKASSASRAEDVKQSSSVTGSLLQQIDSTRTSETEITYTKIEYYAPLDPAKQEEPKNDERPAPQPAEAPGDNGVPRFTAPVQTPANAGAVKSIEQLTIRTKDESKTEASNSREVAASRDSTATLSEQTATQQEPDAKAVKASRSWAKAVIAVAAVLAVIALGLYLWKAGVFSWIKARLNR